MKRTLILLSVLFLALTVIGQTPLKKVYDENINPNTQIDNALAQAKAAGKFVICQVGGNWCPWCLLFADFATNDTLVSQAIANDFVFIHVNYNPRQMDDPVKVQQATTMMKRLGNPARFGFPVFVILDAKGKVLHIQDSSFLEEGRGYNREKVLRFLKNWTPQAVKN